MKTFVRAALAVAVVASFAAAAPVRADKPADKHPNIQDRVDSLEEDVARHTHQIGRLKDGQAAQDAAIAGLQGDAAQKAGQIGGLAGQVNALAATVNGHSTDIADLKEKVAAIPAADDCAPAPLNCHTVTRLFTFNGVDPLQGALDLTTGRAGLVEIETGEPYGDTGVFNYNSHVRIVGYGNSLGIQAGVQGGQEGALVDLGTAGDLQGSAGQVLYGDPFGTIRLTAERNGFVYGPAWVLNGNQYEPGTAPLPLTQANAVFSGAPDTAPIQIGHIYVGRITDFRGESFQILFKFIVTEVTPSSATIRYRVFTAQ